MMCVLIIITLIPVRTDSCMRLPFWRQMFSCVVMWVDSNWGKRSAWQYAVHCCFIPFLFFPFSPSPLSFLGLSARQEFDAITSAAAGKPLGHSSSSSSTGCQHIGGRLRAGLWTRLNSAALKAVWRCFLSSHVIPAADWAWRSCLQAALNFRQSLYVLKLSVPHQIPFFGSFCAAWCSRALSVLWFHMKEITAWAKLWVKINHL